MQNDKDLQRPEHSLTFRLDFEIRIFLLNIRVFLLPKAFAIWLFFWFPPDISTRNQQNPGVVAVANPLPSSVFGKSWDSGFTGWRFHRVGSEVWMAVVLLGTWVGLEYFWLFLLDFVLAGRSATWRWKLHVPHVVLQQNDICFSPVYIALFHIYLKRVYVNVYILFFKMSVWIYICGPHDIWIELWVPHSCLFPTTTTFLGHASFNAPKVSSCLCRDVPNTKDHLDSNIHEQWVRRPQYNGVWTLAFQDTKLHCWSTKLLRCDSRSRTLRGVRLFLFFATKKHHLFFGGEVGKPLESPWPFPFFSGRNQVHPNAAAHPLGSFGSNPAIRSLLWVEDDGLWSPRLSGVTSYAVGYDKGKLYFCLLVGNMKKNTKGFCWGYILMDSKWCSGV